MAHLSLQKQAENQGVVHSVTHSSFDRAVKRFILACLTGVSVAGATREGETEANSKGSAGRLSAEAIKFAKAQDDLGTAAAGNAGRQFADPHRTRRSFTSRIKPTLTSLSRK